MDKIAQGDVYQATGIARRLFEHSASLIACQIAGITEFKKRDMTFVMEGSLFWIAWRYKQMVETYVKQLVPEYSVTFEEISRTLGCGRCACRSRRWC